jgi:hypothetical protein
MNFNTFWRPTGESLKRALLCVAGIIGFGILN